MADTKLFFATDIHGSDTCMRKFLNAARFYGCDVVVMGGDITGKMIVPIVADSAGTFRARLFGTDEVVDADGLAALRKRITDAGYYPYDTEPDEMAELAGSPERVDELFTRVMRERPSCAGWRSPRNAWPARERCACWPPATTTRRSWTRCCRARRG